MIYTVRTTVGRESTVIETLSTRSTNMQAGIKAFVHPEELKGYIFIEGDVHSIENVISGVPHVKGIIRKEMPLAELKRFLETKKIEIKIDRGDVVEIIGGPFKNEKGKVVRVDEAKGEITLELMGSAIPIPISISIDSVRIVEKIGGGTVG